MQMQQIKTYHNTPAAAEVDSPFLAVAYSRATEIKASVIKLLLEGQIFQVGKRLFCKGTKVEKVETLNESDCPKVYSTPVYPAS